jgi:hypothetical protein
MSAKRNITSYHIMPNVAMLRAKSIPSSIFGGVDFAGAEAIQINMPGTAAQTKMVRIISQTAVIFSTIDSNDF